MVLRPVTNHRGSSGIIATCWFGPVPLLTSGTKIGADASWASKELEQSLSRRRADRQITRNKGAAAIAETGRKNQGKDIRKSPRTLAWGELYQVAKNVGPAAASSTSVLLCIVRTCLSSRTLVLCSFYVKGLYWWGNQELKCFAFTEC